MEIFMGIALATFIFIAKFISMASSATPPVTFVFGDSLTEVGNNNFLQYSLAKSNYPWYGIDYASGQATGRFTNGRTIAAKLGISSPPPYLSLSPNDDALLEGVNYASGGAGILNDTGLYFAAVKLCNEALYFIGIGSNDYVNNFLQPFLADGQQYTHDEFVGLLTSTFREQLLRLYQLGARKMVIHGVGPLGCIPSQRVKSKKGQCLKRVNQWVLEFNSKVQKLISSLNKKLPKSSILFADSYPAVYDLITNPTEYGFKVSNTSCCNVDTSIGGLCLPNSKPCSNRRDYVFWDAFHPSDAANAVLADRLFSTLFSAPPSLAPTPHSD
ncbi:hypothetical protein FEM48_Zijuj04G0168800 [Ziziphus jujuba var. spinosa]|uniref:GDSL esterase/lipase At5g37690 n=1 Tax=Ziziphus jujuba var. spinosa TaxID=714518 RepID=A0A978VL17_ZIZJJ|nr:hypothetical protein FEM48_Zijuj04G0168800 [Ziziphus jujuba var. spinosa]